MKKRKVLLMLILSAAMGASALLSACSFVSRPADWSGLESSVHEHEYDEGVETKSATCSEKGETTYTCVGCGEVRTEEIEMLAHEFGEWTLIEVPLCQVEGLERRTCANCDAEEERAVDALPVAYTVTIVYGEKDTELVGVAADGLYELEARKKTGYGFIKWVTEDGDEFPAQGEVFQDVTVHPVYSSIEVTTAEQLERYAASGAREILIASDIVLDRTIYIVSDTTVYSERDCVISRAPEFGGDMFVVGEDKDGNNVLLDNKRAILNIGREDGGDGVLTIDGNKDEVTADVVGSAVFVINSSVVNMYDSARIINHKKTGNDRVYRWGKLTSSEIQAGGAGAMIVNGTWNMYGGSFENNEVNETDLSNGDSESELYRISTYGGAVFNGGTFYMYGGEFKGNISYTGGGIFSTKIVEIYGGIFRENKVVNKGGAIVLSGGVNVELYIGDESRAASGEESVQFIGNESGSRGGAISSSSHSPIVIYGNTAFVENTAPTNSGGAIATTGSLTVKNSRFSNNFAYHHGGAVYTAYNYADRVPRIFDAENTLFEGNRANRGGSVSISAMTDGVKGGKAFFKSCEFISNVAEIRMEEVVVEPPVEDNPVLPDDPGLPETPEEPEGPESSETPNETGAVTFNRAVLFEETDGEQIPETPVAPEGDGTQDPQDPDAGAPETPEGNTPGAEEEPELPETGEPEPEEPTVIYEAKYGNGGAIYITQRSEVVIVDCSFTENKAENIGGAINITANGKVEISSSEFTSNSAELGGGVISTNGTSTVYFKDGTRFTGNSTGKYGGVAYIRGNTSFYAENVESVDNFANNCGGFAYVHTSVAEISGVTASGNESARGGFVYASTQSQVTIFDSNLSENKATYGGAVAISNAQEAKLQNSVLHGNTAKQGGAVYIVRAAVTVENTEFTNNTATNGGALYGVIENEIGNTVTLVGGKFYANTAMHGGAIYGNNTLLTVTGTVFEQNASTSDDYGGGAMYLSGANVTLDGISLLGNTAACNGGAVTMYSATELTAINVTAKGNSAGEMGGVFYNSKSVLHLDGENSIYGGDTAEDANKAKLGSVAAGGNISTLDILVVTVKGNIASSGGAVYIGANGTLTMMGTKLVNNEGENGGALYVTKATASLVSCVFEGNKAVNGAGMYTSDGAEVVIGEQTTFSQNEASCYGGAFASYKNSFLRLENVTLLSNFGNNCAGGAYVHASTVEFVAVSAQENSSQKGGFAYVSTNSQVSIFDSQINNNVAVSGGAIYASKNKDLTVQNVLFSENTATDGGALYAVGSAVKVEQTNFIANTATGNGGGMYVGVKEDGETQIFSSFAVMGALFEANTAKNGGAICAMDSATGEVRSTTVVENVSDEGAGLYLKNKAFVTAWDETIFKRNDASVYGGVASVYQGAFLKLVGTDIIANNGVRCAGGVYVNNAELDMASLTAADNTSQKGVVVYASTNSVVRLSDLTMQENFATERGGAVVASFAEDVQIKNCLFENNGVEKMLVNEETGTEEKVRGNGGALYVTASSVTVDSVSFVNNFGAYGGGLYVTKDEESVSTVTVTNCSFLNNQANFGGAAYGGGSELTIKATLFEENLSTGESYGGGAAYFTGAKVTLDSVIFTNNKAVENGGAVTMYTATELTAINVIAKGNVAENMGGVFYNSKSMLNIQGENTVFGGETEAEANKAIGGAVIVGTGDNSFTEITGATFLGNVASSKGGAIYIIEACRITDTVFKNNQAELGGALAVYAGSLETENCVFQNNTAEYGGAVVVESGVFSSVNDSYAENTASSRGGAVYSHLKNEKATDGNEVTLSLSEFKNNTATDGGAVCLLATKANVSETDFVNNQATAKGGALYTTSENSIGTELTVATSVFTENTAEHGGAACLYHATVEASSTQFTSNLSTGVTHGGGALYVSGSTVVAEDVSFIANTAVNNGGAITLYSDAEFTARNVIAKANEAQTWGGAVFYNNSSFLKIEGENGLYGGETAEDANKAKNGAVIAGVEGSVIEIAESSFVGNIAEANGGVIHTGENCTVTNACFKNNTAKYGGAIYVNGAVVSITDTTFSENNANYGGAVSVHNNGTLTVDGGEMTDNYGINCAGGSYVHTAKATFTNVTAIGNGSEKGGYIYGSNSSEVEVIDSLLKNNTADKGNGGAIFMNASSISLTIRDSEISENSAKANGGAVYAQGNVTTNGAIFASNTAVLGGAVFVTESIYNAQNDTFEANTATENGGAIYVTANTTETTGVTFQLNTAVLGGAVYVDGGKYTSTGDTYEANTATTGGAVYVQGGEYASKDDTFTANTASNYGGAVSVSQGMAQAENTAFTGNTAIRGGAIYSMVQDKIGSTITLIGGSFEENVATLGGALYTNSATVSVSGTEFNANSATSEDYGGGAIYASNTQAEIDGASFTGNVSTWNGGAITTYSASTFTLRNVVAKGNKATDCGGMFYNSKSTLNIEGVDSLYGGENAEDANSAKSGGVICGSTESIVNIADASFIGNTATNGGVVYAMVNCTVVDARFEKNTATNNGGVIYAKGATLRMESTTFAENEATTDGGAIYLDSTTADILSSNFANNIANHYSGVVSVIANSQLTVSDTSLSGNYGKNCGGVAYVHTSKATFTSVTATENSSQKGGMIYASTKSEVEILSSTLKGNKASAGNGGAVFMTSAATSMTIKNNEISENYAKANGGAIYVLTKSVVTEGNTIKANTASLGGAVYVDGGSYTSTNDIFEANSATNGGAIYVLTNVAETTGATFKANTATNGGAIYVDNGSYTSTGDTFEANSATNGGAVYVTAGSYTSNNGTYTENQASGIGGVIYVHNTATLTTVGNTFIGNSATTKGGAIALDGSTQISTNDTFTQNVSGQGGAMYLQSLDNKDVVLSTFTATNIVLDGNQAQTSTGGAMYMKDKSTVSITGMKAVNNRTKTNGSVFYVTESGTHLTLDGAIEVSGNVSGSGDTCMYLSSSKLTIDKSEVTDLAGATLDWSKLIKKNSSATVEEIA